MNGDKVDEVDKADKVDKSGARVRAMFESIAGRYDLLNHLLSANQDKRWRRRTMAQLAPRRDQLVLDVCCGTGDLSFECLRQQPRCRVVGLDFAVTMLQIAAAKTNPTQHSSLSTLHFLAGDALRLPFAESTFDAAMVAFGARNFEDTRAGLREMRRVVKPGGKVLILEFMRPTSPLLQRGFGLFFTKVLPIIGRVVSRHASAYDYLPASVHGFFTRREFAKLLRESGFTDVRAFDYSGGIATNFIAVRPEEKKTDA